MNTNNLIDSARDRDIKMVKYLVEKGADLNIQNKTVSKLFIN